MKVTWQFRCRCWWQTNRGVPMINEISPKRDWEVDQYDMYWICYNCVCLSCGCSLVGVKLNETDEEWTYSEYVMVSKNIFTKLTWNLAFYTPVNIIPLSSSSIVVYDPSFIRTKRSASSDSHWPWHNMQVLCHTQLFFGYLQGITQVDSVSLIVP